MLRHGETAWNTERRMQGTKDSALTERGRLQAIAMAPHAELELAREPGPTVFLRSPLGRVRETVGDHRPRARPRCRPMARRSAAAELSYGQWEGF